ncbi:MAG TPA: M23 family metallopeptidase [Thermoanaerobaculia bacterium]|nr:M23 family metallopeptidase [Thermoanaerobaculia bacterium]
MKDERRRGPIVGVGAAALAVPLAGALLFGATGEARAPRLVVHATPSRPKQGALVVLSVRSSRPLSELRIAGKPARAPLERGSNGMAFHGLVGIDLARAPGNLSLGFEGTETDGSAFSGSYTLRVVSGRFPSEPLRVAPEFVEPPADALPRIDAERERVASLWKAPEQPRRWAGPFRLPVEGALRDNFGARRVFNGRPRSPHNGVDFPAPAGTPVRAPAPARVALAEELYFSGGTVILDHGGGLFTSYFHLSRLEVAEGELVREGQEIGAVGSTGRVTGPHLHWSARLEGARVNPLFLLRLPSWPLP